MEDLTLNKSLLSKISFHQNIESIFRMFFEVYDSFSEYDRACYRRLMLSTAIEHKHTELMIYLLVNARSDARNDVIMSSPVSKAQPSPHEVASDSLNDSPSPLSGETFSTPSVSSNGEMDTRNDDSQSTSDSLCKPITSMQSSMPFEETDSGFLQDMSSSLSDEVSLKKDTSTSSSSVCEETICDSLVAISKASSVSKEAVSDSQNDTSLLSKTPLQSCSLAEEITQLLISDDMSLNEKGIHSLLASGRDAFTDERGCRNPLFAMIALVKDCYFERKDLALPELIQLFINSGAQVNDRMDGFTPLNYLMSRVKEMGTNNDTHGRLGNHMFVELTRILLVAGSKPDGLVADAGLDGPGMRSPLDHLIEAMKGPFMYWVDTIETYLGYQFLLIANLMELLLAYGAKPRKWFYCDTYLHFFSKAAFFAQGYEWKASMPNCLNFCNNVLDGLGSIYRCFSLVEGLFKDTDVLGNSGMSENAFADYFIGIASFLSPCRLPQGRSTKIIYHVLNSMSTTQRNILKRILSERLATMTELSPEDLRKIIDERPEEEHSLCNLHAFVKNALIWVCEVEKSFDLQHLARHAVLCAMKHRSVVSFSTLQLPKHFEGYMLLKIDSINL